MRNSPLTVPTESEVHNPIVSIRTDIAILSTSLFITSKSLIKVVFDCVRKFGRNFFRRSTPVLYLQDCSFYSKFWGFYLPS